MYIYCEFGGGYLDAREFMKNLLEKSIETSIFENLHGLREFLISSNVGEGTPVASPGFFRGMGERPGHGFHALPAGGSWGEGAPDGSEVSLFK